MDADFRFAGMYYHTNSHLHLTLFRAYDADTGRWLSRDPIGEAGGRKFVWICEQRSIERHRSIRITRRCSRRRTLEPYQ